MAEVHNMLTRLKELSIQAANGTLKDEERGMLNAEYMELRHEIEREINTTRMRGDTLLRPTGHSHSREFQIGTKTDQNSKLVINQEDLTLSEFNMTIVDSHIDSVEDARINLSHIDTAIQKVAENRARVGSLSNRLQSSVNNLDTAKLNESAANSQRMDADYAYETAVKINSEHKQKAATAVLAQTNNFSSMALKLLKD